MTIKHLFYVLLIATPLFCVAQIDTLKLDDVILSDVKLKRYQTSNTLRVLNDSVLQTKSVNTTEFLRFNTPIYFKENGFGMISSPAFRGTSASQTAVIWNGININSRLNGQTDFNALSLDGIDQLTVKSGGNSVAYGTGAIGGSVHLNNILEFNKHFKNRLTLQLGSFNTQRYAYNLSVGNDGFSVSSNIQYTTSNNDYKYLDTDLTNENGVFNNLNIGINAGGFVSKHHLLKLYHQSFSSDRELSRTLVAPSNDRYNDETHRTLLKWTHLGSEFTQEINLAHIFETYKYYPNKTLSDYSFGKASTFLGRYSMDYKFTNAFKANAILEFNSVVGNGTSILKTTNNTLSSALLLDYTLNEKLSFDGSIRKDINNDFNTPLVYSLGARYKVFGGYEVSLNASKDFRIPTFNDLYWQPGGNLDLVPENSRQLNLGQTFRYKKWLTLNTNVFIIDIEDMIQWRPNNSGVWSPLNINEVESKGLEFIANITLKRLQFALNYSYTDSRNKATDKQLIYLPFNRFSGTLAYNFKNTNVYVKQLINDQVYDIGRVLDAYAVTDVGADYTLQTKTLGDIKLGININNVFNINYSNVGVRPMPNRNFNFLINYKL